MSGGAGRGAPLEYPTLAVPIQRTYRYLSVVNGKYPSGKSLNLDGNSSVLVDMQSFTGTRFVNLPQIFTFTLIIPPNTLVSGVLRIPFWYSCPTVIALGITPGDIYRDESLTDPDSIVNSYFDSPPMYNCNVTVDVPNIKKYLFTQTFDVIYSNTTSSVVTVAFTYSTNFQIVAAAASSSVVSLYCGNPYQLNSDSLVVYGITPYACSYVGPPLNPTSTAWNDTTPTTDLYFAS